jgi:hypothetical protein
MRSSMCDRSTSVRPACSHVSRRTDRARSRRVAARAQRPTPAAQALTDATLDRTGAEIPVAVDPRAARRIVGAARTGRRR